MSSQSHISSAPLRGAQVGVPAQQRSERHKRDRRRCVAAPASSNRSRPPRAGRRSTSPTTCSAT